MTDTEKKKFLEKFGQRVRQARTEKGMTLEELANQLGYKTENARSSVQKIESGKSDLGASKIYAIAKILDIPIAKLMGWWDEEDSKADLEVLSSELDVAAILQKEYGKDNLQLFSEFLSLHPKEREEISGLLSSYAKLDEGDRTNVINAVRGMINGMLQAEKYSAKEGSSNGKAM